MTRTDPHGHEVPTEHVVPRITSGEAARAASAAATRAVIGRGRTDKEAAALIERFGHHPDGYLHARVVVNGTPFYFHRRYGSWLAPGQLGNQPVLKEPEALLGPVLGREVKFALSKRSQPIDNARRLEREREREQHAKKGSTPSTGDAGGNGEAGPDAGLREGADSLDADDGEVRPDGA